MDDHILADEKVLMYEPHTGDTFSVNEQALTKYSEKLKEEFEKLGEELRRIGYVSCNCLAEVLNDTFDYNFTGPEEDIEKLEPAEPVYDISWIRKRMKCCKNPMERKQLEKQLNAAYKARKKVRKKND